MARSSLQPHLVARIGGVLRVLFICRISGDNQDPRSLEDQQALLENWLQTNYDGKTNVRVIAGKGSGERLTRPEAEEVDRIVEANEVDLLVAEDLGRIYRRLQAMILCEFCEDQGIRVIALNDHVDTFQDQWRVSGMFAAVRHELYNADTSKRIKRSQRNRFLNGGMIHEFPYGYVKPPGAKSDAQVYKLPEAELVYNRWFQILEEGGTYADVTDFLNSHGIPVGPYCRVTTKRWTAQLVAHVTHNPILKGLRQRNKKMSVRINRTGEHKSVAAPPEERLTRDCPHLAFIDPERYDRVIAMLKLRNAKYRRKEVNGADPRKGVSRKRTRWPGQHLYCGVCDNMFVFGAHGIRGRLVCRGTRAYECWMSTSVNALLARRKLIDAIWQEVENLPDFATEMQAALNEAAFQQNEGLDQQLAVLDRRKTEHARQVSNLQRALLEYGPNEYVQPEMSRLRQEAEEIKLLDQELQKRRIDQVRVPSLDEIKSELREVLVQVAEESQEAARLLRRMITQIVVNPYRLVDGGHIVPRAEFTIDLSAAWPQQLPSAPELKRTIQVDLFEPPQREVFRKRIVELRAQGLMQREIADQLGITQPAVQNALKLQAKIDQQGLSDPYQQVTKPPSDSTRYKRHRHPRFRQDSSDEEQAA